MDEPCASHPADPGERCSAREIRGRESGPVGEVGEEDRAICTGVDPKVRRRRADPRVDRGYLVVERYGYGRPAVGSTVGSGRVCIDRAVIVVDA